MSNKTWRRYYLAHLSNEEIKGIGADPRHVDHRGILTIQREHDDEEADRFRAIWLHKLSAADSMLVNTGSPYKGGDQ